MRTTPIVALCVFVIGVVSGVAMNFNVIVPTLARSVLHVGAPGLGLLMAAIGFGSLCGALAVAALRRPRTWAILGGAALLGTLSVAAGAVIRQDFNLTSAARYGADAASSVKLDPFVVATSRETT